jgi:cell division septal protein FtsQ
MEMKDYKKSLVRSPLRLKSGRMYLKYLLIMIAVYLTVFTSGKLIKINPGGTIVYQREDIEITGNKYISNETILQICGFGTKKAGSAEIDLHLVSQKIMELDFIRGVSITSRPPRILNITVEERQPVAFIYGLGLNLIDSEGYLMPVPDLNISWDMPLISGIRQRLGKLGQPATAHDVYLALEIVRYLESEHPLLSGLISEIDMSARDYIQIYLVHGGAKIRTNKGSFDKELYILKTYLANYYDWHMLQQTEYIDLRFADQIIIKTRA